MSDEIIDMPAPDSAVAPDPMVAPDPQPVEAAPEPAPRVPRNPAHEVGLDRGRDGTYDYITFGGRRDRAIVVEGQRFEHVADDPDGCWLYRHAHI